MSQTFQRIRELAARGDIMISAHSYDELAAEGTLCVGTTAGLPRPAHPHRLGDRQADILARGGSDGLSAGSSSLVRGFHEETGMTPRRQIKLVREGEYVAEVEIELIDTGEGWSPYVSLEDAQRLDDVREALRRGDITAAGKRSRVFRLIPVTA